MSRQYCIWKVLGWWQPQPQPWQLVLPPRCPRNNASSAVSLGVLCCFTMFQLMQTLFQYFTAGFHFPSWLCASESIDFALFQPLFMTLTWFWTHLHVCSVKWLIPAMSKFLKWNTSESSLQEHGFPLIVPLPSWVLMTEALLMGQESGPHPTWKK